jgi:hypothetical protein
MGKHMFGSRDVPLRTDSPEKERVENFRPEKNPECDISTIRFCHPML